MRCWPKVPSNQPHCWRTRGLDMLPQGKAFWTEEQSRHNFETVSKLIGSRNPSLSLFLRIPPSRQRLCSAVADIHQEYAANLRPRIDPDWKNMKAWVLGYAVRAFHALTGELCRNLCIPPRTAIKISFRWAIRHDSDRNFVCPMRISVLRGMELNPAPATFCASSGVFTVLL